MLRRDRALVVASLIGVTVLAWLYLAKLALDMAAGDMSLMGMGQMTAMDSTPWDGTTFALLYVMWLVMMIGMMVPSATPMILLYAVVKRKAGEKGLTPPPALPPSKGREMHYRRVRSRRYGVRISGPFSVMSTSSMRRTPSRSSWI